MSTTMNVAGVRTRLPTAGTARSSIAAPMRSIRAPRVRARRDAGRPMKVHARLGGVAEVAGNAAVAVVEVSKAVRMRGVEAPDVQKSFVAKGGADVDSDGGPVAVDEEGLPLVYDKTAIQAFWDKQGGALQKRWAEFLGLSVPFLTRVATLSITGGAAELAKNDASLARDARIIIEKLGPTYIKAGQMMLSLIHI